MNSFRKTISSLFSKRKNPPLFNKTIGEWLEYWAEKTPEKEAVVYSDRDLRFTYAALNARVDNLAKGLLAIGIGKGTHVGIWATNVPDWLTLFYACAKLGAVCITVNTNYMQNELEYLCENADIHTLCIIDQNKDVSYLDMVYKMLPELKSCRRGELKSKRFPKIKNVVFIGQEKYRGLFNIQELMILGANEDDAQLSEIKSQNKCGDVVNIQYTSGTTGFPKGVMLSHYGITNNGYIIGEHMNFTSKDRLCCCVPLFHCFGIVLGAMNCITHGCTMVMVEKFDPLVVLASIHRERCTALYGVPTMFISELSHPMFNMFNLRSLRVGIIAGALCPVELMREVEKRMFMKVTSVYGLTEASPGMTQTRYSQSFEERCTTVGYAFENIEVKLINTQTGEDCLVGEEGEFCCRGYNVMLGYYNDPKGTAEVIDDNGFLHSGDLGVMDKNGNYRVTGRIKEMIIRGGENIYPKEIEEFLFGLDGIEQVQVVGLPSKRYGEVVAAFIKRTPQSTVTEEDIKDFCRGAISRFKIPKYIFFVDEFPMTGSGKIQKFRLKDLGVDILKREGVEIL